MTSKTKQQTPNKLDLSTTELCSRLSELYRVPQNRISVFGLRTHYASGKSTGFALIYDSRGALKKFEPSYRLVRLKEAVKVMKSNRQNSMLYLGRAGVGLLICYNYM